MAGAKSVWGIDIGRCALKAVKLRLGADGDVELVAHDYVEHPKILSQPDADKEELIANALEKFLSRNDITNDKIAISVPGQQTLARFTKLPPVDDKRIPDIVRYEADQQIPFDMDEVIWDYQVFKEEGSPDVEVGIFAMKREQIRAHLLPFEQSGVEPIVVQTAPLAVFNAAHFEGLIKPGETTILLDVGAEATDLIICTPHGLWTRAIPIGGNRFTEALIKAFKLSFSKAEKLKREAAKSRYARQIFQAMRPVFNDLVQELLRSIGFYSTTHRGAKIERVITFGNACKLPGLVKYLQQNLGYEVEEPQAYAKLAGSEAAKAPQFTSELLSFTVPYGLALQALDQSRITSSLLPVEIAKQVVWQKKRPFLAAAAACLVLSGGTLWLRYTWDMQALGRQPGDKPITQVSDAEALGIIQNGPPATYSKRQQTEAILAAAQSFKRRYADLKSKGEAERKAGETIVQLQEDKALVPAIVNAIHSALPQAQKPYGTAENVEEYVAAVHQEGGARSQREEVIIRSLNMEFKVGVSQVELLKDKLNSEPLFDLKAPSDGFFVSLKCTTANAEGDRFMASFVNRLRETGKQPGKGFYFHRVHLTDWREVQAEERLSEAVVDAPRKPAVGGAGNAPSGPGGRGVVSPTDEASQRMLEEEELRRQAGKSRTGGQPVLKSPRPQPSQPAPTAQTPNIANNLDFVTAEKLEGGWEFGIEMDVILGDAPESGADQANGAVDSKSKGADADKPKGDEGAKPKTPPKGAGKGD